MRCELEAALELFRVLPAEQQPQLCADLELIRVVVLSRLTSPTIEAREDTFLGVEQTAARMHVSPGSVFGTRGLGNPEKFLWALAATEI